jgi:hypothetical protein
MSFKRKFKGLRRFMATLRKKSLKLNGVTYNKWNDSMKAQFQYIREDY